MNVPSIFAPETYHALPTHVLVDAIDTLRTAWSKRAPLPIELELAPKLAAEAERRDLDITI